MTMHHPPRTAGSDGATDLGAGGARRWQARLACRRLFDLIEVDTLEMKFEPKTLSARAGDATFVVKNVGSIEHNFVIEDGSGQSVGRIANIAVGGTEQLAGPLKAGTYTFICSLPGHKEAGMAGTLTVT